ncbi:ImmA/IrrE family metallo-endopeptidase [Marinobacter salarius]|uniref:ImmA/IrrE family metallo-endopeptidase n=1 Tax=Marinobacter salarius TaxID=1420917 RepID=UPI0025A31B19|nr:ImmA/IrrE family metallo-endopeptidase [Marinobacter salarius]MDM8181019.1 ImmA/IrrE family metallo-endopeptidase [Marinobacter salarius]
MGIDSPDDVDLEVMAFFCGARVKYRDLTSCAARIVGKDNRAIITVDRRTSFERQRFSIAHELGHWVQDRGQVSVSCRSADLTPFKLKNFQIDREAAANRFAVELLMPTYLFSKAAHDKTMTIESARVLAAQFRVSLTAAAIRLVELGSYPAIVVCSSKNGYQWSWRHPEIPLSIRVNRLISRHSVAQHLHSDAKFEPPGPTTVDADDWVSHTQVEDYVLTEDSVRIGRDSVLSLIWWHDEGPLISYDL